MNRNLSGRLSEGEERGSEADKGGDCEPGGGDVGCPLLLYRGWPPPLDFVAQTLDRAAAPLIFLMRCLPLVDYLRDLYHVPNSRHRAN